MTIATLPLHKTNVGCVGVKKEVTTRAECSVCGRRDMRRVLLTHSYRFPFFNIKFKAPDAFQHYDRKEQFRVSFVLMKY